MRRRPLAGAIAGVAATVVMTGAMRLLHQRLPAELRYPLPPREIVGPALPAWLGEASHEEITLAAHAAYGGLAGALFALVLPEGRLRTGALYGAGVWLASYLGWIPLMGILRPVHRHPDRRNLLMLGVHLLWGGYLAYSLRQLTRAETGMLSAGPAEDAPEARRRRRS